MSSIAFINGTEFPLFSVNTRRTRLTILLCTMVGNNAKDGIKKLINFLEEFVVEKLTSDFRNM